MISQIESQPAETVKKPTVVEKKNKWNPIGFTEVEDANKESNNEQIKQESELEKDKVSSYTVETIKPTEAKHSEPLADMKVEKVPVTDTEPKAKTGKKEKIVAFKKRKIDSAQQNLRERSNIDD